MRRRLSLILLAATAISGSLSAQTPERISFQGSLESSGVPVTDTLQITFTIYDSTGTDIWSETISDVSIIDGVFSVELGGGTPLSGLSFDHGYEVGISVAGDPEMSPKVSLTSVPSALNLRHVRVVNDSRGVIILGGDYGNQAAVDAFGATISGGGIEGTLFTPVGCVPHPGGFINYVGGAWGVIGGGAKNHACLVSTVSGGDFNAATGGWATIGGGSENEAIAKWSTVAGGVENVSSGTGSSVPGGGSNAASGDYSMAAGHRAHANHDGSFVWNDRSQVIDTLETTANNQFLIRAAGGVGIGTNSPDGFLDIDNVFKVQTYATGVENQNARLFFSESNTNKLYGYSIIYAGATGPQTFDGQVFNLPANELLFVRHNNSGEGNWVMAMERATGDVTFANDVTFASDVNVFGGLTVTGTKSFKIDHPLDPENKYLIHYALESSEVLNVYSGNVVTDANGVTVVELPDWFEALNKDFRYQLTVIGSFSRATIAEKIQDGHFTIRTEDPGVEVSWQVTAVRDDPAARERQPVEVWK